MATIPGREDRALRSISSIASQVDEVHVVLNYGPGARSPQWADNAPSNTYFYMADNSRGDAEKFRMSDGSKQGYIFTCDDDILYAPGYADYLEFAVDRHERRHPVGLFGARVSQDITDYYADRKQVGRLHKRKLKSDTLAHIAGTNTVCYHTDTLPVIPMSAFARPNMADIFFGAWCNNAGCSIMILSHNGSMISDMARGDKHSIYATRAEHSAIQAEECRVVHWRQL
jgi:hypothetical protein